MNCKSEENDKICRNFCVSPENIKRVIKTAREKARKNHEEDYGDGKTWNYNAGYEEGLYKALIDLGLPWFDVDKPHELEHTYRKDLER